MQISITGIIIFKVWKKRALSQFESFYKISFSWNGFTVQYFESFSLESSSDLLHRSDPDSCSHPVVLPQDGCGRTTGWLWFFGSVTGFPFCSTSDLASCHKSKECVCDQAIGDVSVSTKAVKLKEIEIVAQMKQLRPSDTPSGQSWNSSTKLQSHSIGLTPLDCGCHGVSSRCSKTHNGQENIKRILCNLN